MSKKVLYLLGSLVSTDYLSANNVSRFIAKPQLTAASHVIAASQEGSKQAGEVCLRKIEVVAQEQDTDIAENESLHATSRRVAEVKSIQTHRATVVATSAESASTPGPVDTSSDLSSDDVGAGSGTVTPAAALTHTLPTHLRSS